MGMLQRGGSILGMESAAKEALLVGPSRITMRRSIVWVEPQSLIEETQRFIRVCVGMRHSPQIDIIGVEAVGSLAARPLYLSPPQRRLHRPDNALCQPILQVKNVFDRAFEFIGPDVCRICPLDQLSGNAQPVCGLPDAAFQNVADAEFLGDMASSLYG